MKKDQQKITKVKPFINKYNWRGRSYPSEKSDWKKITKNNLTIVLNVLHAKNEKMYPANVSKHNPNCEKQTFLLMIPNRYDWYYIELKNTISIMRETTSKHHADFYCFELTSFCKRKQR